jgi:hypothetical protein
MFMLNFKTFYFSEGFKIKLTDEIAKWVLDDTESWEGYGETDEEAIDEWKKSLTKNQLNVPYPKGFKDMPDMLPICRVVYLTSPEELNKKKLGNHWFPSKDIMEEVLKEQRVNIFGATVAKMDEERKRKDEYLISAQIDPKYIGIKETLAARTDRTEEYEIFIPNASQSKIKVLSVEKLDEEL